MCIRDSNNYTKEVKTGGDIEIKYLSMGDYKVKKVKKDGSEITKKYYIYYPEELSNINKKHPVVAVSYTHLLNNIS